MEAACEESELKLKLKLKRKIVESELKLKTKNHRTHMDRVQNYTDDLNNCTHDYENLKDSREIQIKALNALEGELHWYKAEIDRKKRRIADTKERCDELAKEIANYVDGRPLGSTLIGFMASWCIVSNIKS